MENWDEEKLRSVVLSKHGNPRTTTDVSPLVHYAPRGMSHGSSDRMQVLYRGDRNPEVRQGLVRSACHSRTNSIHEDSAGSGNVLMAARNVNIGMLCHQASS